MRERIPISTNLGIYRRLSINGILQYLVENRYYHFFITIYDCEIIFFSIRYITTEHSKEDKQINCIFTRIRRIYNFCNFLIMK